MQASEKSSAAVVLGVRCLVMVSACRHGRRARHRVTDGQAGSIDTIEVRWCCRHPILAHLCQHYG